LYILDEPSTGLHAADIDLLLAQLQQLVEAGNTVIVVEHELRMIAASDWMIDMGPGAGDAGGRIVASGAPRELCVHDTPTTRYLRRFLA
jgi:excinuclease ABC subunit A